MNSEELEISLRAEFESYLKDVFAGLRQEVSQLQEKLDAELERHKSELNGVFSNALNNFENTPELGEGFKETVIEHLRLAKDEGARITATAIAQAEELKEKTEPAAGIKEIHEAISDISGKQSQADILKALVQHAEQFAPRGAFFIIKNDHLIGWRIFGQENTSTDEKVREVILPVSSESVLSDAVKSLETARTSSLSYDDAELFNRFDFGGGQQATAIPLVARGRGVAVLYADSGADEQAVNVEALESLVRVAGLTVEVLASAKGTVRREPVKQAFVVAQDSSSATETAQATAVQEPATETETEEVSQEASSDYSASAAEYQQEPQEEEVESSYETTEPVEAQPFYDPAPSIAPSVREDLPEEATEELPSEPYSSDEYRTEEYQFEKPSETTTYETEELQPIASEDKQPEEIETGYVAQQTEEFATDEKRGWTEYADTQDYSAREYAENFAKETDPSEYAKDFSYQTEEAKAEESDSYAYQPATEQEDSYVEPQTEEAQPESYGDYQPPPTESYNSPVETSTPQAEPSYQSFEPQVEKQEEPVQSFEPIISQPVQPATKTRLSERNVDLPIEVSEDERRLHNDARRFARLLVSEIKLYNEQKVKEGRDSGDLYDRLREAIDRSREMYDKRVQPPVAAKFDYFHYEVLNTLAEGDVNKLGAGYPGANVR